MELESLRLRLRLRPPGTGFCSGTPEMQLGDTAWQPPWINALPPSRSWCKLASSYVQPRRQNLSGQPVVKQRRSRLRQQGRFLPATGARVHHFFMSHWHLRLWRPQLSVHLRLFVQVVLTVQSLIFSILRRIGRRLGFGHRWMKNLAPIAVAGLARLACRTRRSRRAGVSRLLCLVDSMISLSTLHDNIQLAPCFCVDAWASAFGMG
mmetsp:Transcript_51329/g.109902  ORF Transcript_51329/g.109902 Transcript_51329/m.109902 type:complete len:207 (+) Transcript_51329:193-813(+)